MIKSSPFPFHFDVTADLQRAAAAAAGMQIQAIDAGACRDVSPIVIKSWARVCRWVMSADGKKAFLASLQERLLLFPGKRERKIGAY